jgi:LacI family transcriptional regulator
LVSIKDVAKQAGVSTSTVSRVLTGNTPVTSKTKDRVLRVVKELGYRPNALAQGLKGGRIKTIGLIIPNVRNLVFPTAIRGIEDAAHQYGYTVVLCNTDEDSEREKLYIENLKSRLIDGFIFSTARDGHRYISELQRADFPVVSLIRHIDQTTDAVVLDNFGGAYQAVQYMIGRGLRQIGIINGSLDIRLYRDRFAGYRKALEDNGVTISSDYIVHGIDGGEDAFRVMNNWLQRGIIPEAVFTTNDPKALGAIRAIKDFGLRIPEDISVMGFDNFDIAPLIDPPLTTVAQPFYEMGVKACERLIKRIEEKRPLRVKVEVLPAQLVIRKSVK